MSNVNEWFGYILEAEDVTKQKLETILENVYNVETHYVTKIETSSDKLKALQKDLNAFFDKIDETRPVMPKDATHLPGLTPPQAAALTMALIQMYGPGATIDTHLSTPEQIAQARLNAEKNGIDLPLTKDQLEASQEAYERLKKEQKDIPSGVIINPEASNVPASPTDNPRDLPVTNSQEHRSPDAYTEVLASMDVTSEDRYRKLADGTTFCNIYVWDVTMAMGCEIPHWYDISTGERVPYDKFDWKNNPNHRWMNANMMVDWLRNFGAKNGWSSTGTVAKTPNDTGQIKANQAKAIEMANQGHPVVAVWKNPGGIGHVAMVAPQRGEDIGTDKVMVYQSGYYNLEYAPIGNTGSQAGGFGTHAWEVEYFYHA